MWQNSGGVTNYKQMNKSVFALFVALGIYSGTLFCQEQQENEPVNNKGFNIFLVPQYAIVGTFKVEFDKRIRNTSSWLIFGPSYTAQYNDNMFDLSYESKIGGGLNISHRYYMSKLKAGKGLYLQYGAVYNYNMLTYEDEVWVNTTYEGTDATISETKTVKDHYHKFGMDFIIGYQYVSTLNDRLVLDVYVGMGTRNTYATTTGNTPQNENSSNGILSPAFEGVLPVGGIRIGVSF